MYAQEIVYEIHACLKGQWNAIGIFHDPNKAFAEAVKLRHSHQYAGIRVTEVFQDAVDRLTARVIYRYTAEKDHRSVAPTISQPATIDSPALATHGHLGMRQGAAKLGGFVIATLLVLMTIGVA
jgi:hypothetical protein